MIVYIQQQTLTPKDIIRSAGILKNRVYLFRRFKERKLMFWRIVQPLNLAKALFPPLVFVSLLFNRFKASDDFRLLPFIYVHAVSERLQLWKTCTRERVFQFKQNYSVALSHTLNFRGTLERYNKILLESVPFTI